MTKLRELLAAAKKKIEVQGQQRLAQDQVNSVSSQLKLNPARRRENLRLLRTYMDADQKEFVSMLGVGCQSLYSRFERGESQLDDKQARKIESGVGLPPGWLDRDNGATILLSNDEWHLIHELRKSSPEATLALIQTAKSLRLGRSASA